jgi:proteasome lid subunit RPN8/RPN11
MTSGKIASVDFDPYYVLNQEDAHHNVIGFLHTHPHWTASPSDRDFKTMTAWVSCLGKSLICAIHGTDGLRAYWYDDDVEEPVECEIKRFGNLLVGTTEIED